MKNLAQNEKNSKVINDICSQLKELEFLSSHLAFEKLIKNQYIDSMYEYCAKDSLNRSINRHDKLHALTVTLNSLKIFKILKDETSLRRLQNPFTGKDAFGFYLLNALPRLYNIDVELAEDFCCTSILIASYCHDIFRFMTKDHQVGAALLVQNIVKDTLPSLMNPKLTMQIGFEGFMPTIHGSVLRHEGNEEALSAEEGLIMISDVIDNDEERINVTSLKDVILNDQKPIEYFSCKNIYHPVDISRGKREKKVDLTVRLKGDAGWHHVKQMLNVLSNSGLESYISINVKTPEENEKIIF